MQMCKFLTRFGGQSLLRSLLFTTLLDQIGSDRWCDG